MRIAGSISTKKTMPVISELNEELLRPMEWRGVFDSSNVNFALNGLGWKKMEAAETVGLVADCHSTVRQFSQDPANNSSPPFGARVLCEESDKSFVVRVRSYITGDGYRQQEQLTWLWFWRSKSENTEPSLSFALLATAAATTSDEIFNCIAGPIDSYYDENCSPDYESSTAALASLTAGHFWLAMEGLRTVVS